MISDTVHLDFISNESLLAWAQTAQAGLASLLQISRVNLGHLEEFLENQARKLMLPILHAAAHALAAQQPFQCPVKGVNP